MVVLGQGDDVALGGDLEAAAPGHLDVRALELGHQAAVAVEDGHVELVAVRVAHQDVAGVGDVDAVGEAGDAVVPDPAQQVPVLADDHHVVALEVADVIFSAEDGNVGRLVHELGALVVPQQVATFGQDEDGGGDRVHGHNVALVRDGQAGHDVDEADGDPPDEGALGAEYLHARPLAAPIANHKVPVSLQDGHLARVPQAPLLLARVTKHVPEESVFIENLKTQEQIQCFKAFFFLRTLFSNEKSRTILERMG